MTDQQPLSDDRPDNSVIDLDHLQKSAVGGDSEAQFQLGMLYANGDGVDLSYSKAADLIKAAAESGLVRAQSTLAWLYANGYGVEQSDDSAFLWYRKAAEQGSLKDIYVMGTLYRFGQLGCKKDIAKAIEWFQHAANHSFAPAQFALGKLIMDGKYVERDNIAAFQWLSLANANGSKGAEGALKKLLGQMSKEELEQARGLVTGGGRN